MNEVNPVLWNYNAIDCACLKALKTSSFRLVSVDISGFSRAFGPFWAVETRQSTYFWPVSPPKVTPRCYARGLWQGGAVPGGSGCHHHGAELCPGASLGRFRGEILPFSMVLGCFKESKA